MNRDERQVALEKKVKENPLYTPDWKIAKGFAASNGMLVTEAGLELADVDLASVKDKPGFVILSSLGVPPGNEVYAAVYVGKDAPAFCSRLKTMQERGVSEIKEKGKAQTHAEKNNNTAVLVSRDGNLYLRNKGRWIGAPPDIDLTDFSPGIKVDRVEVAVYPPVKGALQSLIAMEFIGYLRTLFGKDKVHEIEPWPTEFTVSEQAARNPRDVSLQEIQSTIKKLGGYYPLDLLARYHSALNYLDTKHFVLLKGLSGTGKTKLAIDYSKAVHGISDPKALDPFFFPCPVRPDWTDPSGLLGYNDPILRRYVVPRFLQAVLTAHAYSHVPVFVCLDELNLAPVEYYFSPVLSSMESDNIRLELHSSSVALEGDNGEQIIDSLPLPKNLYIVGTINVDETVHQVSDKVLDRAVLIDTSTTDIAGFLTNLRERVPGLSASIDSCTEILSDLSTILGQEQLGFGYRVAEEFVRYHHFSTTTLDRKQAQALDEQITDKILVKLRGSEKQRLMLEKLAAKLSPYKGASQGISRVLNDLDDFHSFQWTR